MEIPKIDFISFVNTATDSMKYKTKKEEKIWYSAKCDCGFGMTSTDYSKEECPKCKSKLVWKKERV